MIVAKNFNEVYRQLITEVDENYEYEVKPRGMSIKEKIGLQFRITNPKDCYCSIPSRKLNHPFSVIEKFEYLYGKHDPTRLIAYNKNFESFKGEYGYFDGNYAQRFNYWLEHVYGLLKKDPDSRQAVVSIYDPTARHQSKDIPCTLTLQFFIRDGKLILMVNMRSNDLLWGTPYDVNGFAFLQEVMASWLGIEIGEYIHTNGSTHIYTDNKDRYGMLINTSQDMEDNGIVNPPFMLSYEDTKKYLPMFMSCEELMRTNPNSGEWKVLYDLLPFSLRMYINILQTKWI
jgi:thymidylate synthase